MKKKFIFILIVVLLITTIGVIFLLKLEYKGNKLGNNISKSDNTDILNISSYEAKVTIEVHSNKNTNKYVINQRYVGPDMFTQEVIEPSNIKGLTITKEGEKTILENKTLDLKTLYENFKGDSSNLSLISFIEEYKEGTGNKEEETENERIMQTEITKSKNKYQNYQKLYISKSTNLPTKMEILDINKNTTIYILYNEIKLNQINKKSVQ